MHTGRGLSGRNSLFLKNKSRNLKIFAKGFAILIITEGGGSINGILITRADDFGSANAANAAILKALSAGCLVRNVSCMAVGSQIESGAEALAPWASQVDLGLHLTVNAEWDCLKWKPLSPPEAIPALLDEAGNFHQTSLGLERAAPPPEQVLREASAQLDRLTALGLPITYVDGHMFPYLYVPGLEPALRQWCREKGLLYAAAYDSLYQGGPAFGATYEAFSQSVEQWLGTLHGQTRLYVMHPAQFSPETMAFANRDFPAGVVAWERELEYRSAIDPVWTERTERFGLTLKRFRDLPAAQT